VDNVVDFMKFKKARDEVVAQDEEMNQFQNGLQDFFMNESAYSSGTFTFTLETEDE
jgi:negative regulator of sigma E activity